MLFCLQSSEETVGGKSHIFRLQEKESKVVGEIPGRWTGMGLAVTPAFRISKQQRPVDMALNVKGKAAGSPFAERQSEGAGARGSAGKLRKQELSTLCPMP